MPAARLFHHPQPAEFDGIGTFETYPNRDSRGYLKQFGLDDDVTLYRGVLRFPGWCATMTSMLALDLLENTENKEFKGKTYAEFTASLIGSDTTENIEGKTAKFLKIEKNDASMEKFKWLGLFGDEKMSVSKGTNADVLVDLMIKKMSYAPNEKDMVIVANDIIAKFSDHSEKISSAMVIEGIPGGDSAMSRAVALPAAIASKLILDGKITSKGVLRPLSPEIYTPVLKEMEDFGIRFNRKTTKL